MGGIHVHVIEGDGYNEGIIEKGMIGIKSQK